jgi:hypothetical protein
MSEMTVQDKATDTEAPTQTTGQNEDCHHGTASPLNIQMSPLPNHLLHIQKAEVRPVLSAIAYASHP